MSSALDCFRIDIPFRKCYNIDKKFMYKGVNMSYKTYEVRVYVNGTKKWYLNGKLHREDGPAYERSNGTKIWYLNGKRHREDGPAVEYPDGTKIWYLNGKFHREDGPAVEWADGSKEWFLNGKRHREDGPAIEWADGTKEWFLNGNELTKKEWERKTKKVKEMTVAEISKKLGYEVKVVKD